MALPDSRSGVANRVPYSIDFPLAKSCGRLKIDPDFLTLPPLRGKV